MNLKLLPHFLLIAIVAVYVVVGVLYAGQTPAWQVPDEPAHYNYVRALAEGRGFPVIEPGDYDQAYLGRLTSERFPPGLSIESLEYEDHQPPLYYVLAAPVYLLFDGALLPLRSLSVFFGAGLLVAAFGTVCSIFPERPDLGLMTAGFMAFIPQHVAMSAGVNNDTLAELVVAGTLWALVVYVGRDGEHERPWPVGLLLGAVLLTKVTAYAILGVAVLAVAIRWRRERRAWPWAARQLAWMFLPALILSAPWFIRNGLTYGWHDPLGLARHNVVVEGQPRSSQWLADYGWTGLLGRMLGTTFQSFWGQFGWMGVVLPRRIYGGLALLTAFLGAGFLWWLFDRRPRLTQAQRADLALLFALFSFVLLEFLGYNLTFVQHQGRYLFPGLIPIGVAFALGLSRWARILPWPIRPWAPIGLFAALAAFDVYCLARFIVPSLAR